MRLKGTIDELREQVFKAKSRKRNLPWALKMKELEDTMDFIDEDEWKVKKKGGDSHNDNPTNQEPGTN